MGGCPDTNGIRALVWKFLLNYLSVDATKRESELVECRLGYESYVKEFIVQSCEKSDTIGDHPLSSEPNGNWKSFFKDNEILLQIDKDCQRLCPDIEFFRRPTDYSSSSLFGPDVPIGVLRRRCETCSLQSKSLSRNLIGVNNMIRMPMYDPFLPSDVLTSGLRPDSNCPQTASHSTHVLDHQRSSNYSGRLVELHWHVIERILFIYYKTHISQKYVQGMNEIIAPIYFVFANDPSSTNRKYAEMDTFYCFNNLMSEIHPNFIRKLDGGQTSGIGGQINILSNLVGRFDPPLLQYFSNLGLLLEHFAFRWLSLLLSREFTLPDVLLLWDTLFSDSQRFTLLPYVCCSMLMLIRDDLLQSDFPRALQLLQNYPPTVDITLVLDKAKKLYATDYTM